MASMLSLEAASMEDGSSDDSFTPMTRGSRQPRTVGFWKATTGLGAKAAAVLGTASLAAVATLALVSAPSSSASAARSTVTLLGESLPCGKPESDDSCSRDIAYAKAHIKAHPDWYVGLHKDSNFKQVQAFLHKQKGHGGVPRCPRPCGHVEEGDDGHRAMYSGKCHTAKTGEECYNHIIYTRREMLPNHPEWYPGLDPEAGFKVVQDYLHQQDVCPTPCGLQRAKKKDALKRKAKNKKLAEMEEELDCHTAVAGEGCYGDILWAEKHLEKHGEWYKGLTPDSSRDEIQAFLSKQHNSDPSKLCPRPCNKTANEMLEHVNVKSSCHTAETGVACYKSVLWVIAQGMDKHPEWYENLTRLATFEDVQQRLVKNKDKHCTRDPCPCKTAEDGDKCFKSIKWVMKDGLKKHPKWYEGLSENSTLEDFQLRLHSDKRPLCPMPCQRTPWLKYGEDGKPEAVPIDIEGNVIDAWPSATTEII